MINLIVFGLMVAFLGLVMLAGDKSSKPKPENDAEASKTTAS